MLLNRAKYRFLRSIRVQEKQSDRGHRVSPVTAFGWLPDASTPSALTGRSMIGDIS